MNRIESVGQQRIVTVLAVLLVGLGLGWLLGGSYATAAEGRRMEAATAVQVGSGFTYQGFLQDGNGPIQGSCDLRFSLWDAAALGTQVGLSEDELGVMFDNGRFTVTVNEAGQFGSEAFAGEARWLEIWVRCPAGGSGWTMLEPRQPLNGAPYAHSLRPGTVISGSVATGILTIQNSSGDGVFVADAGGATNHFTGATPAGFEVAGSAGSGLYIGRTDQDGIHIRETGFEGIDIENAERDGFEVDSTGQDGVHVQSAGDDGVHVVNAVNDGFQVGTAGIDGVRVFNAGRYGINAGTTVSHGTRIGNAGGDGVHINHADGDGVFICSTGSNSGCTPSGFNNGLEISNADDYGVWVNSVGNMGLYVASSAGNGVWVNSASFFGVVAFANNDGANFYGDEDGNGAGDGLYANKLNATNGEWGINTPDKLFAGGGLNSTALTIVAEVAEGQTLEAGDLAAAVGLAAIVQEEEASTMVPLVAQAGSGSNLIGVVEGRMGMVTNPIPEDIEEGEYRKKTTLRSQPGPAGPGDYVAITVLGVAQVKVDSGASIQPGQRLTADAVSGLARPLQVVEIDGVPLTEGAPAIGIALEAPQLGQETIPVFVTLR